MSFPRCTFLLFIYPLIVIVVGVPRCTNTLQCSEENISNNADYCYVTDEERPQAKLFATITAYRIATKDLPQSKDEFVIPNCKPTKAIFWSRHGLRLPSTKEQEPLRRVEQLHKELIANVNALSTKPLCSDDFEAIKQWTWNRTVTGDRGSDLSTEGFEELRHIALKYQQHIPNLFNRSYNPNEFYFGHTEKKRTRDSFRAFVDALFGEDAHLQINTGLPDGRAELLLKTYSYCKEWNDLKESVGLPDSEPKKFERSELFVNMVKDINQRFGFNGTLQLDDIINMYDICRNEQAWNINVGSGWCSLFTTSQFKILEYLEDMRTLYKSSQEFNINKNIACHAIKDLLYHLESNESPIVTAYFTHSTRVQQVLATLGAFHGEKLLKSDNFNEMHNRKWKTSVVSPSAANLVVVKYECGTEFNVKFFINEKTLHLDWCSADGLCKLSDMQTKFARLKDADCDQVFCQGDV